MPEYKVYIEEQEYQVDADFQNEVTIDGKKHKIDLVKLNGGQYSVIFDNDVYEISVIQQTDLLYTINAYNESYELVIEDERARLLKKFTKKEDADKKELIIKAPMPGLVLKVEVGVGQSISAGTGLVILEAMKMENEIKSTRNGIVKEIKVVEKMAVEKGEVLMILE
ncbi:MAG: biotin/lipoyl-containing protein [Bacteroidota bacterium]